VVAKREDVSKKAAKNPHVISLYQKKLEEKEALVRMVLN